LTVVEPGDEKAFLAPLPVQKLLWVGKKTARKLRKMGVETIGDLAKIDASVLKQIRGLNMSEHDLISLSENDRNIIVQETLNLLSSMRKLFFHIASEAERLSGSGEITKAQEYLSSIRNYGSSLSGPDHLQVVQLHGKAATGYAEKKLSELQ